VRLVTFSFLQYNENSFFAFDQMVHNLVPFFFSIEMFRNVLELLNLLIKHANASQHVLQYCNFYLHFKV